MDTVSAAQFNAGFDFAISQGMPLLGSLVVLGVLIYVVKKVFHL